MELFCLEIRVFMDTQANPEIQPAKEGGQSSATVHLDLAGVSAQVAAIKGAVEQTIAVWRELGVPVQITCQDSLEHAPSP